jgi:hypothetical protein
VGYLTAQITRAQALDNEREQSFDEQSTGMSERANG